MRQLGLPRTIQACLFDLDGVLTQTAHVHATAWKAMFDAFLRDRAAQTDEPFVPFDPVAEGAATDPPGANTVQRLVVSQPATPTVPTEVDLAE